jgi:hypothetical protein
MACQYTERAQRGDALVKRLHFEPKRCGEPHPAPIEGEHEFVVDGAIILQ